MTAQKGVRAVKRRLSLKGWGPILAAALFGFVLGPH